MKLNQCLINCFCSPGGWQTVLIGRYPSPNVAVGRRTTTCIQRDISKIIQNHPKISKNIQNHSWFPYPIHLMEIHPAQRLQLLLGDLFVWEVLREKPRGPVFSDLWTKQVLTTGFSELGLVWLVPFSFWDMPYRRYCMARRIVSLENQSQESMGETSKAPEMISLFQPFTFTAFMGRLVGLVTTNQSKLLLHKDCSCETGTRSKSRSDCLAWSEKQHWHWHWTTIATCKVECHVLHRFMQRCSKNGNISYIGRKASPESVLKYVENLRLGRQCEETMLNCTISIDISLFHIQ